MMPCNDAIRAELLHTGDTAVVHIQCVVWFIEVGKSRWLTGTQSFIHELS